MNTERESSEIGRDSSNPRKDSSDPREDSSGAEALVRAARSGERSAFDRLIERHFGSVYAIAYAYLQNREAAEDLTQEVFLRAYLFLDQLNDPARFPGWLGRMARNFALQWLRTGRRASQLVSLVPLEEAHATVADERSPDAREQLAREEQQAAVRAAIARLPGDLREIVFLHHVGEVSLTDIAEQRGVHLSTVSRKHDQALKRLRGILEPLIEGMDAARAPVAATAASHPLSPLVAPSSTVASSRDLSRESARESVRASVRASVEPLRPPRHVMVKTAGLVAAASALSSTAKASLVAHAVETGAALGSHSVAASSSGAFSSFLSALPALLKSIGFILKSGGAIVMGAKGITLTVAVVAVVGGGIYLGKQNLFSSSDSRRNATQSAPGAGGAVSGEKQVIAAFETMQQYIRDKNYQALASCWATPESPENMKQQVESDLNDKMIGPFDYLAKAKSYKIQQATSRTTPQGAVALMILQATEPDRGTTCHVQFELQNGRWLITDINNLSGFGLPLDKSTAIPEIPSQNTTAMNGEEVIRGFYGAIIAKEYDRAAGYLQFPSKEMTFQYRIILQQIQSRIPILSINEVKVSGKQGFIRFGVAKGFPGEGVAKKPNERQGKLILVQSTNGLKIDGAASSIFGDRPGDYR